MCRRLAEACFIFCIAYLKRLATPQRIFKHRVVQRLDLRYILVGNKIYLPSSD